MLNHIITKSGINFADKPQPIYYVLVKIETVLKIKVWSSICGIA